MHSLTGNTRHSSSSSILGSLPFGSVVSRTGPAAWRLCQNSTVLRRHSLHHVYRCSGTQSAQSLHTVGSATPGYHSVSGHSTLLRCMIFKSPPPQVPMQHTSSSIMSSLALLFNVFLWPILPLNQGAVGRALLRNMLDFFSWPSAPSFITRLIWTNNLCRSSFFSKTTIGDYNCAYWCTFVTLEHPAITPIVYNSMGQRSLRLSLTKWSEACYIILSYTGGQCVKGPLWRAQSPAYKTAYSDNHITQYMAIQLYCIQ